MKSDTGQTSFKIGLRLSVGCLAVSLVFYILLGYFANRTNFSILFPEFAVLFGLYLLLYHSTLNLRLLILAAIGFRLALFFMVPNLSDDFYRFIWDGRLIAAGINPFSQLPTDIIHQKSAIPGIDKYLFDHLNSPEYYTIYPPVCQFIFYLAALVGKNSIFVSVLVMRSLALAAEAGTLLMMGKLLRHYGIPERRVLLYALNPLVILELTGNLHFESLMVFFVLCSIWMLAKNKLAWAGVFFALAVASKLIPLVFLPLFVLRLGWRRSLAFCGWILVFLAFLFLPLLNNGFLHGFSDSFALYFQKFEFNASVFYVIRALGFWAKGWDIIQSAGKWLALSTFVLVVFIAFFQNLKTNNVIGMLIWPLIVYYLLASIVHPWYSIPLVAFGLFSKYRFPVLWSGLVFLSYQGYMPSGFKENFWLVFIEYALVIGFMVYELMRYKDLLDLKAFLRLGEEDFTSIGGNSTL